MKLALRLVVLLLGVALLLATQPAVPQTASAQTGEPRFSYPGAVRQQITSYFDHSQPDVFYNTVDDQLVIYTTERGLSSNNCADCYRSGSVLVCGYFTAPRDPNNCLSGDGRQIYYDMHPAFDYGFPQNSPVAAAASGTAYVRAELGAAVVIDHGGGYWTKYGHVDPVSRIMDASPVVRGQQIALSSDTGTGAYHLHFQSDWGGENGTVFDPYGWQGDWYTDPWNSPYGHTADWWRSDDPIPAGYRDENGASQGPFTIAGTFGTWWDEHDGEPGAPVRPAGSNNCPGDYGDCQFFEKGYLRWDYASITWHAYSAARIPPLFAFPGHTATIAITNQSGSPAQVSVTFSENGHIVDTLTNMNVGAYATWTLNVGNSLGIMTDRFTGSATIYSNQPTSVSAVNSPSLQSVFLPLTMK